MAFAQRTYSSYLNFFYYFEDIIGYLKHNKKAVHIGDILDADTIIYTYNCLQFICSNAGFDIKYSTNCQRKHLCFVKNRNRMCFCTRSY